MNSRVILRIIQWAVTLGSLALILLMIDVRNVLVVLSTANYAYVAVAVIIALGQFILGAWRWKMMIALVANTQTTLKPLLNLYLMSFFVSSILPGTITGDALRIYDTRKTVAGSAMAASIVIAERIFGLVILVIVGIVAWLFLPAHPPVDFVRPQWLLPGFLIMCLAGLFLFQILKSRSSRVAAVRHWFYQLFYTFARLPQLAARWPWLSGKILIASLLYQVCAILIVYEALEAAHFSVPLAQFLIVAPVVTLLLILPISIQGLGLRESLYLAFLLPVGAQANVIIAGLTLTYFIGLPFILWGWFLFSRRAKEGLNLHDSL